ncbi:MULTISPECIES: 30S ribosomal protein S17 [Spiribacter]|jgi:small subunit ribosomal protein S17|uniref:Small ribosomal subunit protein uS17 n=2 Tax=Spiribacter TaxID=1335745 RepID=A0A557RGR5_9GAMM|nr:MULTISPECIES: 30S ribosomal protein S17 [Spiribacter]PZA00006.1 30S ribosomal protein S17 [Gammaproteobacteria bacterium 2W06]AUB78950.1 30S ribosomal protein S17 [Spiribacter roseus]KAF0280894.1 30S ribosomal protein S17 [Spiribacter roseus]KAF0281629.1 30S ribosomal protein S17 [Spiribacter roseus]KAF0284504.1 30S ribosomal protein S17 [Spiribacter roseus]
MSNKESVKRTVNGRVVSTAMDKTITVVVERLVPHPLYGKYIRRTTKVHAHDEDNVCQKGDWVSVVECRPVSKQKTWRLVDVLERAVQ